jgi:[protein-PII] uridylyltransferase
MLPLKNPHEIIDKNRLLKELGIPPSIKDLGETIMPLLHTAYIKGKDEIKKRFYAHPKTLAAVLETTYLIDTILAFLYETAEPFYASNHTLAIVATGGYGRAEMFPYSDVDLLFLHTKEDKKAGELAQWMLYCLWDISLTVGHAVRTVEETLSHAKQDITICTALLDARFLCGEQKLYDKFHTQFEYYINSESATAFVETKLSEQDNRHHRCGDSRYVLEPNIKEGKGSLRDLHTICWLAKYIYHTEHAIDLVTKNLLTAAEYKSFMMAEDFLWLVRMHLHYLAGRGEERLTFDMQRAVAEAMGYYDDSTARAVERFMKQYFLVARTVGDLTRSICAILEEDKKRKPRITLAERMQAAPTLGEFYLDGERLALKAEDGFKKNPVLLITLFQVAHEHGYDIHPRTLQWVTRNLNLVGPGLRHNKAANDAFLNILLSDKNPEPTLRRMSEAGVLGKFIPDFGHVIGQMQFDMYHVYTVDEHTIFAIGILHGIITGKYTEEMPIASEIIHLVKSRRVLFLSVFAHDIAKGRGGDHSMLGEVIVRKLTRRFGFDAHETDSCAWLVRHHLLMSRTAFKRDLGDEKTIQDFVTAAQSPERLRLLLILTVADIRAVGPHVWNGWKGALLRDLYYRAEEKMGASDAKNTKNGKAYLEKEIKQLLPDIPPKTIQSYLDQGNPSLWASCDAKTHARIMQVLNKMEASGSPIAIHTESDMFRAITDITLCTNDKPGLFSKVSGAMALAGANILSAKIFTLKDGMAVEIFNIQDGENQAFNRPDKLARLSTLITKAIEGELDIAKDMAATRLPYPSRMEVFKIPPRVFIENKVSANHTVIEVGGRDRIGFLHNVTRVLADLGLTISTAHITTYGERAVDVFYVKDQFGMKILHESKMKIIQEKIISAISSSNKTKQAG